MPEVAERSTVEILRAAKAFPGNLSERLQSVSSSLPQLAQVRAVTFEAAADHGHASTFLFNETCADYVIEGILDAAAALAEQEATNA